MKHLPAIGAVFFIAAGSIQGCSSDENAATGGASPDASAGGSGTGGRLAGATGGAAAAPTGGVGGSTGTGGGSGGTGGSATGGVPNGTGGGGIAGADARSPEPTGQACKTASDCFPGIDAGALSGPVECLTKVQDGYCTHECTTDADCCKVAGECRTDLKQVCAPFENTGRKVCFLSCEPGDIRLPGDGGTTLADGAPAFADGNAFCQKEANPDFICRSTGGGSKNRKVCVPGGGGPGGDGGPRPDAGHPPDAAQNPDGSATRDASGDATSDSAPPDAAGDRG